MTQLKTLFLAIMLASSNAHATPYEDAMKAGAELQKAGQFAGAQAQFEKARATDGITPGERALALLDISTSFGKQFKWQPQNTSEQALPRTVLKEFAPTQALMETERAALQIAIAKTFMHERNYAEARTELTKAQAMPGLTDALKVEIQLFIALSYYDAGDYENAKPVIYESPLPQAAEYPAKFQAFHDDNLALMKSLKAPLAPCVKTWMNYLGPKPTPDRFTFLYDDWIHASPKGAYITACSVYAALTGFSPVGLAHPGLSEDEARLLQELAWEAFQESHSETR